jgi:hypothetical protein
MRPLAITCVVLLAGFGGCKRTASQSPASPPPAPAKAPPDIEQEYDAKTDRTTVWTRRIEKSIAGRKITVAANYTFAGTEAANPVSEITLMVRSFPSGRGVEGDELYSIIIANGKPLPRRQPTEVSTDDGVRRYFVSLWVSEFRQMADADAATIRVNDLNIDLDAQDLRRLGKLVPAVPDESENQKPRSIFDFSNRP